MQNEELSDINTKVKFPPRTIWISLIILLSMLTITIMWFKVANNYDWSKVSLGDIGAILSGTFTALAWYWFIEAYLLQSKELTLQRKTLETQVEELKHSVQAQKGSEKALQEQSKVLAAQLKITEKQFSLLIEEKNINKPTFFVELTKLQLSQICDANINREKFEVTIHYSNKRGNADIRDIECISPRENTVKTPITKFLEQYLFEATSNLDTFTIKSDFSLYDLALEQIKLGNYINDVGELGKTLTVMQKILIDILLACELRIYYDSKRLGMGMEKCIFHVFNQNVRLSRNNIQIISVP